MQHLAEAVADSIDDQVMPATFRLQLGHRDRLKVGSMAICQAFGLVLDDSADGEGLRRVVFEDIDIF